MKKDIPLAIIFLLSALVLSGCAQKKLWHPTKTQEDYKRESYICEEEALLRSAQWGNVGMLVLKESERQRCMKERFGWQDCSNATTEAPREMEKEAVKAATPEKIAPRVYTHTVRQVFGGAQSPDDARTAAMARAKREVLEQAGTYLETMTVVQENKVAKDEVLALAAGVLRAEIVSEKNFVDGQAFGIEVMARVEVDPAILQKRVEKLLSDRQTWERIKELEARERALLNRLAELEAENRKLPGDAPASEALKKDFTDTSRAMRAVNLVLAAMALWKDEGCSDPAKAVELLTEAINLAPDIPPAYAYRGVAYSNIGLYELAILDFDQVIRFDPDFGYAYFKRGFAHFQLGQNEQAVLDFTAAIKLDPNYIDAYQNRGIVHAQLWQHERAIADFTQAIRLNPRSSASYNARGLSYLILKNEVAGCRDIETACRLGDCGGMEIARRNGQCR